MGAREINADRIGTFVAFCGHDFCAAFYQPNWRLIRSGS
jgi:hypothetical protein